MLYMIIDEFKGIIAWSGEVDMSDNSNDNNEIYCVSPDSIELSCVQRYQGNRSRFGAKFILFIQQMPLDLDADDPVKLRIQRDIAPIVVLYGERITLPWAEYQFLKCLAEHIGTIAPGQEVYQAVYGEYSEVSDYQLYNIKNRLLKRLQDELGVEIITKDWISTPYGQGFRLNMRRGEVEVI